MIWIFATEIPSMASVAFAFDSENEESRESPADATQYPVDSGATMTDYVVIKPETYKFSGIVTTTPLDAKPYVTWDASPGSKRIIDAYDALRKVQTARIPVSLALRYWSPTVWITSVSAKNSRDTGDALEISIEAVEVRRAVPSMTQVPASRLKPKVQVPAAPAPGTGTGAGQPKTKLQGGIAKLKQAVKDAAGGGS